MHLLKLRFSVEKRREKNNDFVQNEKYEIDRDQEFKQIIAAFWLNIDLFANRMSFKRTLTKHNCKLIQTKIQLLRIECNIERPADDRCILKKRNVCMNCNHCLQKKKTRLSSSDV